MLWFAVRSRAALASLRVDIEAELRSDDDLIPYGLQRLTYQLFVREWAVGFGGVKERNTFVVRGPDELDHLVLIACRSVGRSHAHASKADCRDF